MASGADEIEALLVDGGWDREVDMVLSQPAAGTYRVRSPNGSLTFGRRADGDRWVYETLSSSGENPIADDATDRFVGHDVERAERFPSSSVNAYPYALEHISQFFDAPHAPDLVIQHAASHHFDDHFGQHGSLGAIQARAPFIASGPGIRPMGMVDRHTRVVNVAPTIAALLGLDHHPEGRGPTGARRADAFLARQDGDVEWAVLDGSRPDHVVVILLDGCNANLLYDAIDRGEAPNLAGLAGAGTSYRHGAISSLPTATLANHTTASVGAHPGHTGVLHNTWHDRTNGQTPDLLSLDQMFTAMQHLHPSVETIHEAIHRCRPEAFTSATFEFCDRGADHSSFGLIRGGRTPSFPSRGEIHHMDAAAGEESALYAWMSSVDHLSTEETLDIWRQRDGNPLPMLSWLGLAVTDEAGHVGGPHSELARAAVRASDARVGAVLEAIDGAGVLDRTAFLVIADHGMEQNDPDNDRRWTDAIAESGVACRQVADNFIYLG